MTEPSLKEKLAHDHTPVSRALFSAVLDGIGPAVKKAIDARIAKVDARNAELQARLDKSTVALESAERRLSRHADHLSRLETRLKAQEQK